jgi:carnitine O-acetyltransferase
MYQNYINYRTLLFQKWEASPDGVVQVAMQLAFARLHSVRDEESGLPLLGAAYESAAVRSFRHGRTETIRSASGGQFIYSAVPFFSGGMADYFAIFPLEMQKFIGSMLDPCGQVDRCALLRSALSRHVILAKEATSGAGVDRHLLALRKLAGAHNFLVIISL